jgi:DNA-directed RNA polymerase subunit RPC12/RpoP
MIEAEPFNIIIIKRENDIVCPSCHSIMNLEWTTEYGDPRSGDYTIECPACSQVIDIRITNTVKTEITNSR